MLDKENAIDKSVNVNGDNSGIVNSGNHNTIEQNSPTNQTHSGSGDNVAGDKNVYQAPHQTPKILTPSLGTHTNFIGRASELQELQKRLNESNSLLLLNGIGGVGKSSLASYYLSTQKDNYDYYGLVEAGENIKEAFISAFSVSLNLNKEQTIDMSFDEAMLKLRNLEGKKLLVIDDIKAIKEQQPTLQTINSLCDNRFTLLFTSRKSIESIPQYYLDTLSPNDAHTLFVQYYPTHEKQKVESILEYLDNHTLFVEMTAKTLAKRKATLSLDTLLGKFKQGEFSTIKKDRKESFDNLLSNLFAHDSLLEDNEILTLLQKLTLLPSIEISFDRLYTFLVCDDREVLEELLNELADNGWLIAGGESSYKLHQIIKEYILANYAPDYETIKKEIYFFSNLISRPWDPQNAFESQSYLIYFESIVDAIINIKYDKDTVALFYHRIGNTLVSLGEYQKSLRCNKKTLQMSIEFYGENDPSTATAYNDLGNSYLGLKDYKTAKSLYFKSLNIRKKIFGVQYFETAKSYGNLGSLYVQLDKYNRALPFLKKALAINQEDLGEIRRETATSYTALGALYLHLEQYEQTKIYFEQSLKIHKTIGEVHILTAHSYMNLGKLHYFFKNNKKVLYNFQKAVNIYKKILPTNHPYLIQSKKDLETIQAKLKYPSSTTKLQ